MGEIEFTAKQKHMGSPLVVAFDEEGAGHIAEISSLLLSRKNFRDGEIPKHIKVKITWESEH